MACGIKQTKIVTRLITPIVITGCIFLGAQATRREAGSAALNVQVDLTMRQKNNYALHVKLKNNYKNPLLVYDADLPWGNRYSMVAVAVGLRSVGGFTLRE